ncbi:MAG: phosphotransferase [Chloroflexi bacterium]|nr:phosphotransferase [Chloroflexota bacterium]
MIEQLDRLLEGTGQPGLAEVRGALQEVFGESTDGRVVSEQKLKTSVYRLQVEAGGRVRSLVMKRLAPDIALRCQLVVRSWLPSIGLGENAPGLLGIAAERGGQWVWHIYEDLGDWGLDRRNSAPERVATAVELIARLHTRSAGSEVLLDGRRHGSDLGMHFYTSNVRDAITGLEALRPARAELPSELWPLRDRLLERLRGLLDERCYRTQVMDELGGPDVLLHGDLWPHNAFVQPAVDRSQAWLIDWDHTGVGQVSYDLSTLLSRFRAHDRPWMLDRYRQAVGRAGWRLPSARDLNLLFDTAECARCASRILWPCVALLRDQVQWGFVRLQDQLEWGYVALAEIEQWFERLEPVLPTEEARELVR